MNAKWALNILTDQNAAYFSLPWSPPLPVHSAVTGWMRDGIPRGGVRSGQGQGGVVYGWTGDQRWLRLGYF